MCSHGSTELPHLAIHCLLFHLVNQAMPLCPVLVLLRSKNHVRAPKPLQQHRTQHRLHCLASIPICISTPPLSDDAGNLAIQLDGAGRPHLLVGGLHPCPPGDRPGGPPGQGAPGEPNPISLLSFPYPSGRCPGCAAALSVSEKGCWLWCVSDKTPAVMFLVCFDGGLQHHAWLCQN